MFGWRRVKILYLDHDTFEEVSCEMYITVGQLQHCLFIFEQGALQLIELLEGDGIEVKAISFEIEEGIEGLGPDPFVSKSTSCMLI